MRQVELGRGSDLRLESGTPAWRGLWLVGPWVPDTAPGMSGRVATEDGSAPTNDGRGQLELVGVDHARLDRPPAMEVMRQLLDAWRTAEREVVAADGSPELPRIQAHAATLRMLYQGLFAQVQDEHSARTRA